MLGRLEFRGIGWQELQADAVRDLQVLGDMPAGAVEDEHNDLVRSGSDVAGERGQDPVEHRRVYRIGQEPDHIASYRPDEAVDINPLKALVPAGQRALTPARPDLADDRLKAGAMFIEGPHLDRPVRILARQVFHAGAEVGLEPLLSGKVALCVARPRHLPGEPQTP